MNFNDIFQNKPIIGMIHLAGKNHNEKVKRALDEIILFQEEGLNGVIIEDYHGDCNDVFSTLVESSKLNLKIALGINILRNPNSSFDLAIDYNAKFVQFDNFYDIDLAKKKDNIAIFGGVGFKYIPETGNSLEYDLRRAKTIGCNAIVTTGPGTGIETPIEKLREYKKLLNNLPLIVGAGLNPKNAYESLIISDGAIIGSYFKVHGNTKNHIDRQRVKEIMNVVNEVRNV